MHFDKKILTIPMWCSMVRMWEILRNINQNFSIFSNGHRRAPISSERGKSPMQLWIQGAITINSRAIDELWNQVSIKNSLWSCTG